MPVSKTFETINVGTAPQSGDGEPLRNGGIKINSNFDKALENGIIITLDYTLETMTVAGDTFINGKTGILTTSPAANIDATPDAIDTATFTRPFPTVTTTQRDALVGLVQGAGVYDTDFDSLYLYNGSKLRAISSSDIVFVNTMADFPAPAGGVITLDSKRYILVKDMTTTDRFLVPADTNPSIDGVRGNLTYSGTGKLFSSTGLNKFFILRNLTTILTGGGDIFDIDGSSASGVVLLDGTNFIGASTGINNCGTIKNVAAIINTSRITDANEQLILDSNSEIGINSLQFKDWNNQIGANMLRFQGALGVIAGSGIIIETQSNETGIDIDSASTTPSGSLDIIYNDSAGGDLYASGSKDQSDIYWKISGKNLQESTVKGQTNVTGGAATTIIPAVNALVIANISGWIATDTERLSIDTDGYATYTGLEDVSTLLDGNINLEPETATKDLSARFACISAIAFVSTFTNGTNIINETSTDLSDGDTISFKNTAGTLPVELREDVIYYVINKAVDNFQVSYTSGGAAVTFTDDGSGTNSYATTNLVGSTPILPIASGAPRDLIPQAQANEETGCETFLVVANKTDAVNIEVKTGYYRVAKI